ncbi:Uma2 family endonuclease [Pendulispora rubella]|uniref:Uma2 family endonuclease n=1 Tax=Pendulispora rubella TaxID=2741070 RepID=A0ABZ2LHW5_9BACT
MAMGAAEQKYVSYEEYLELERDSLVKHEWLDGIVYAMGGGSTEHSRLALNMTAALKSALAGECVVFSSDAALYVRETKFSTYPNGSVVCGPRDLHRGEKGIGEALLNPVLIVEVLSDSTEKYDRGEKFSHYLRIPTLQEYVLVSQHEPCIEVYRRPKRGHWAHETARAGETLQLHGRTIAVDDIYRE